MHLLFILLAFGLAWLLRLSWGGMPRHPVSHESTGMILMIAPSLFVLMTAISIAWMGPNGMGLPVWEGWLCHIIALAFVGYAIALAGQLLWQNYRLIRYVKTLPAEDVQGYSCRILETTALYSAQCGLRDSEVVVSRGLLNRLNAEHIGAILAHEQGHANSNDIFRYAIVNWFRKLLPFFPYSNPIWKSLIISRELRADKWAAQSIDPLTLAEALLMVAQSPRHDHSSPSMLLSGDFTFSGLSLRVKALVDPEFNMQGAPSISVWCWMIVACCPLIIVPFHH